MQAQRNDTRTMFNYYPSDIIIADTDPNVRCLALIIEEQIVLDNILDLPTAMALLFGFVVRIYALNIQSPKALRYTFENIQKLLMHRDTKGEVFQKHITEALVCWPWSTMHVDGRRVVVGM